ncbi:hypothetical protein HI113_01890 [Corallococcus exiguus]|uniref:hypothetical protein n=1 Tax=Corallococcus exiguus TaxID=83462 RepID=UPI00147422D7|nr:hypothetical protein [Corallococcus exiguus]NNB92663.1 hypothetical protein [Corallococcus exiguus]
MKSRWLSAAVFAVAMAVGACGGPEETDAQEQVSPTGIEQTQPEGPHQQAISCDAEGRCPPNFYCSATWTCRYIGGHL